MTIPNESTTEEIEATLLMTTALMMTRRNRTTTTTTTNFKARRSKLGGSEEPGKQAEDDERVSFQRQLLLPASSPVAAGAELSRNDATSAERASDHYSHGGQCHRRSDLSLIHSFRSLSIPASIYHGYHHHDHDHNHHSRCQRRHLFINQSIHPSIAAFSFEINSASPSNCVRLQASALLEVEKGAAQEK